MDQRPSSNFIEVLDVKQVEGFNEPMSSDSIGIIMEDDIEIFERKSEIKETNLVDSKTSSKDENKKSSEKEILESKEKKLNASNDDATNLVGQNTDSQADNTLNFIDQNINNHKKVFQEKNHLFMSNDNYNDEKSFESSEDLENLLETPQKKITEELVSKIKHEKKLTNIKCSRQSKLNSTLKTDLIVRPSHFMSHSLINAEQLCASKMNCNKNSENYKNTIPEELKVDKLNGQMENMLSYVFSRRKIHPMSVSIFMIGFLYLCVLFGCTYYKNPTQSALNLELKNTLVCADYFSWQVYGFVYFSYNLEYLRLMKEGLIDKSRYTDRGWPNWYKISSIWMREGAGLSYLPDKLIDTEYSKVNQTNLINLNDWNLAHVEFSLYDNITTAQGNDPKVRWFKDTYGRATGLKQFHLRQVNIAARDYENDTSIADIWNGTDYDFERDPEEHMGRINAAGNLLEKYTHLSWMNYNFERKLIAYSEKIG